MTAAEVDLVWGLSNRGETDLLIWLEPWAEEFAIPPRSTITARMSHVESANDVFDIEQTEECVILWAQSGQRIQIYIDGALQKSASAAIAVPDTPGFSTKVLMTVLFENHPEAKLGGRGPAEGAQSFWQKLKRRLGQ